MRLRWCCAALALLAALVWGAPALSAQGKDPRDTLTVTATVSPEGMAVPVEAKVFITLVNSATEPISDIRILSTDGTLIKDVGELSGAGRSSEVFSETLVPTANQLGAGGVEYQIYYTLDKGKPSELRRKITKMAEIERLQAEPNLEFTRKPSATYAQAGGEITITYRLRNTGNVPLTDMVLSDELCGEIDRVESLSPGKKTTFTKSVTIDGNAESRPSVSYIYPGADTPLTKKLDPVTIYKADELLEARIDADRVTVSPGEVVKLQLKLSNRGNVTYDKLEIRDQALGTLGTLPGELKPGEDFWFVKRVNLKSTTTFLFTASGKSQSGAPVTAVSNTLTVAVTPAVDTVQMTISAAADNPNPSGPGQADFTVTIHNSGEMDIRNVAISERARGEIKTLAVAPPGDTAVLVSYPVTQDETFVFMGAVSDAEGGRLTVLSPAVDVKTSAGGMSQTAVQAAPEATAVLGLATAYHMNDGGGMFQRMVVMVLWILGALVLLLLVTSLVRYSRRRKQKRQLIKKLRKNRRGNADTGSLRTVGKVKDDTGVYKKADLVPHKEGT